MKISILTLFNEMFEVFNYSILKRARENSLVEFEIINIRDFSEDKHKRTDDYPFGGGSGMIMSPQPIESSIKYARKSNNGKVIFLGPRGKIFNQEMANELSKEQNLIFLCGHYEGIDERCYEYIDMEISLGDFILTGGEMAAIPIIDSIVRLIPKVLGSDDSHNDESFYNGLLEYPQYTRPYSYKNMEVPKILLSGHHENIRKWRKYQSLMYTREKRIDLFEKYKLSKEDLKILAKFKDDR